MKFPDDPTSATPARLASDEEVDLSTGVASGLAMLGMTDDLGREACVCLTPDELRILAARALLVACHLENVPPDASDLSAWAIATYRDGRGIRFTSVAELGHIPADAILDELSARWCPSDARALTDIDDPEDP